MASLASINILFRADLKQFSTEMQSSLREIRKLGDNLQSVGTTMSIGLTAPVVAFGAASVLAYDESAKALAQVEAGLQSTGGKVGYNSAQLQQFASELQAVTTFDDDTILKQATANLLTFTNVAGEQFQQAQKAALDLATRMDGDLQGATIKIGKALNDPVKGLTALGKVGVQFTESQKQTIKAMVATNDVAGAQTVILKELQMEFGGSAEAAAKAGLGPFQQLKNQIGDLSEEFGKIILDAIQPFVASLSEMVTSFEGLSTETKKTIAIVAGIVAVLGPVIFAVGTMISLVPTFVAGLTGIKTAFAALQATLAANPYTAIALALAAVAFATYQWYESTQTLKKAREDLNNAVAKGTEMATKEVASLDSLYNSATNVKLSTNERKKAVDQLQALYPAYFKNIKDEAILNGEAKVSYDSLRLAIFNKSRASAIDAELQNRANDRVQQEVALRQKIADTETEIQRLKAGSNEIVLQEANYSERTVKSTVSKADAIRAQTALLKKQNADLLKFNDEAFKGDQVLYSAKEEYSKKTGKLLENEKLLKGENNNLSAEGGRVLSSISAGSVGYYDVIISKLKEQQKDLATTSAEWQNYETKIKAAEAQQAKISTSAAPKIKKPPVEQGAIEAPTGLGKEFLSIADLEKKLSRLKELQGQLSNSTDEGKAKYKEYAAAINDTEIQIADIKGIEKIEGVASTFTEVKDRMIEIGQVIGSEVGQAFEGLATQVVGALGLAKTGFEGFIGGLLATVTKLIAMMLAASISQSIAGAAAAGTATGPFAIFTTPAFIATAVGGVLAAFAEIPKFETGGVVGGSSFFGDKILARVNSGELILNRDQQRNLNSRLNPAVTAGDVAVQLMGGFELSGDKLRLVLERADKRTNRIR